jgi:hypothetical protein
MTMLLNSSEVKPVSLAMCGPLLSFIGHEKTQEGNPWATNHVLRFLNPLPHALTPLKESNFVLLP